MPLVTIVMPAYNVEQYISKSIESVINQTNQDWELLIINDGSTDNTLGIIQRFVDQDPRIRVFSQNNKGVAAARNRGLQGAQGCYISFLDADDIYEPSYIEKMVLALVDGNADFAFCKFKKVLGEKVLSETPEITPQYENFPLYLLSVKRHAYAAMATMFAREVIVENSLQFTEGCILGEDSEFVLKVASLGKTVFVPEYLYFYVYRAESASHQDITYQHIFDHYNTYENAKIFIQAQSNSQFKDLYEEHIENCQNSVLNNFRRRLWANIKNGDFDIALEALERYGKPLKVQGGNVLQTIVNGLKIQIINSKNIRLWSIFVQRASRK